MFFAAVALYGVSAIYSIFLFRKGFREDNRINYLLLLVACAIHTMAMFQRGFSLQRCPINNLYEATMFIGWTIVAAYLVIGLWPRLRFLGAFAAPLLFAMGVYAFMLSLGPRQTARPDFSGGAPSLHAALILLSYGAFGLSSLAALMYLNQEHDLKFHRMRALFARMPPIERLEVIIGRLLLAGFLLLTAGLFVGAVALKPPPGVNYWTDAKVVWSVFVWGLYLTLLILRWRFAQTGRRFAWGAVGGFAFVLLTFWGFSLLSGIHNP
jgi:HemX protein